MANDDRPLTEEEALEFLAQIDAQELAELRVYADYASNAIKQLFHEINVRDARIGQLLRRLRHERRDPEGS